MSTPKHTFLANSQIMSAGYAPDLGDSLAPHVTKSDKGTATQRRKPSSPNAVTRLSPAERTALLLDFKRNFSHNYTQQPVPSKPVPVAGARFATA